MADYIVTANAAGSNSGTPGNPHPSLSAANAARTYQPGDRLLCGGGVVRGKVTWTGNLSGVTIMQDPAQATAYEQRGSTLVSGFTVVSGNTYSKTITTGLTLRGVSWNYGNATDSGGSRYGFLALQASAAAVTATGQWFYNSGTGVLTINVGADPSTGTVEYGELGTNNAGVIQMNDLTDCSISGLIVSYGLMNSGEGQYGNLIAATVCTRTVISGNSLYDWGNHATVISGGTLTGNRVSNNFYAGGADFSICHVFYSAGGSSGTDNEANNNTMRLHGYLNITGTASLATTPNIGGFFSHTDSGNIDNLTYRRNLVTFLYGATGTAYSCNNATAPSDDDDWRTYSVKFIQCVMRNGISAGLTSGNCAFVQCDFDWSLSLGATPGYSLIVTGTDKYLWVGCLIASTCNYATLQFNGGDNRFYGCTLINRDATGVNSGQPFFANTIGSFTLTYKGCLLAYSRAPSGNTKVLGGLTATTSNNLYYRFDATTGDATATTTTTDPFQNIATSGVLSAAAWRVRTTYRPPAGWVSMNRQTYSGNYGAYQNGPRPLRARPSSRRGLGPR